MIPPRGILAGAKLPEDSDLAKGYDQAAAKASFREMVLKLNAAGVLAADVSDSKAGPAFFNHADQHWTTKGAQEMAQAVAALVKQPGVWSDKVPNEVFETRTGAEETYDGRFGEPIKDLCDMKPLPEKDVTVTTFSTGGSDGENALFGDKAAPEVVLVGTSNSKRDEFNSNFAGYLQEYLSADVLNAAISGGGMDDSMVAYLDSDAFKAHAPAYVIWEIPGYYNLGGEGMENTLRQAIPSVYGFCQEPVMQFPSQKILAGEKRVYMMQGVGDQKLEIGKVYLTVDFDKPVKKDFSVSFKTSDKESSLFKFKRRREQNGDTFYYLPVPGKLVQKGLYLKDVALNVSDYLEGLTVTARLCPIPEAVAE